MFGARIGSGSLTIELVRPNPQHYLPLTVPYRACLIISGWNNRYRIKLGVESTTLF